jgi:hypothetical protein
MLVERAQLPRQLPTARDFTTPSATAQRCVAQRCLRGGLARVR